MKQYKNLITNKIAFEDTSHAFYNYEGVILKKEIVENNNNWEKLDIKPIKYFYALSLPHPKVSFITGNKYYLCYEKDNIYHWLNDKYRWDYYRNNSYNNSNSKEQFLENFKIIKSEYTILSFSSPQGISRLISNGRYLSSKYKESDLPLSQTDNDGKGATLMDMVEIMEKDDSYKIHSIQRNSDGVIFTIGDFIEHNRKTDYGKIYEISLPPHMKYLKYKTDIFDKLIIKYGEKFENPYSGYWNSISVLNHKEKEYPLCNKDLIKGKYYTTYYNNQGLYTFREGYNLWYNHDNMEIQCCNSDFTYENGFSEFRLATQKEIEHFLNVLGETEDNKSVILGNGYYVVSKEYNYSKAYYIIDNKNMYYLPERNWYFKDPEKANEFIIKNKPCLSIKDIEDNFQFYEHHKYGKTLHGSKTLEILEKIVKSKL